MTPTIIGGVLVVGALIFIVIALLDRARKAGPSTIGLAPGIPRSYTKHAQERMQERGVSREEIESALVAPDRKAPDPTENSVRFEKNFEKGVLKVWVAAVPWPPTSEVAIKSTAWKYVETFEIPATTVGLVKGRQGTTVRGIETCTGAKVSVSREGTVCISAGEQFKVKQARSKVDEIVNTPSLRGGQKTPSLKVGQRHSGLDP